MAEHHAYLGLGSNIEPARNLRLAADALRAGRLTGNTRLVRVSSVWASPPLGAEGPEFLNAVVEIRTQLSPDELKTQVLRPMEAAQGRVRSDDRNAPRTLDLDLLLYDGQEVDADIWQAAHIALPLSELLPDHRGSDGLSLLEAAQRLRKQYPISESPLTLGE